MTRRAARLAWTSLALYVALGVAGLVMLAATPGRLAPEGELGFAFAAVLVSVLLVYAGVGTVVASRRPRNAVG